MSGVEKVLLLQNEIEARLMDSILSERGIPHMITSFYDTAYDGLFQVTRGWGRLDAPAEYRAEILAIHQDLTSRPEQVQDDLD